MTPLIYFSIATICFVLSTILIIVYAKDSPIDDVAFMSLLAILGSLMWPPMLICLGIFVVLIGIATLIIKIQENI